MSEREPRFDPSPKVPEPGEKDIPERVAEESAEIAEDKLEKLMELGFQDFAIRFVNINEYREMMEGEKPVVRPRAEARVPLHLSRRRKEEPYDYEQLNSFNEFLVYHKDGYWADTADYETMAESSSNAMRVYNYLMENYRYGHTTFPKESKHPPAKQNLPDFRASLLELGEKRHVGTMDFTIIREAEKFPAQKEDLGSSLKDLEGIMTPDHYSKVIRTLDDAIHKEYVRNSKASYFDEEKRDLIVRESNVSEQDYNKVRQLVDKVYETKRHFASYGGEENLAVVSRFREDPDFLNKRENRRALFNAVAYANRPEKYDRWRHYHVVLVYSTRALSHERYPLPDGGYLSSNLEEKHLLGAISIMPNKELWQEMAERSSKAGKLSHPVFDNKGTVRYPEKTRI